MGAACFWWQATKINVATGILCECVRTYLLYNFFNICIVLCIFTVYIYTVFIHIYYTHEIKLAVSKTSERALLLNISSHIHRGAPTFGYELSWFPHGPCSKNVLGASLVHLASALGFLVWRFLVSTLLSWFRNRMEGWELCFFWTSIEDQRRSVYPSCHHGSVEILLNSGSHLNKVAMELSIRKISWSQLCQGIGFGSFRGDFASQSVLWSWKFKLFVTFSWTFRKPLGPVHHGNWRHLGEHLFQAVLKDGYLTSD